MLSLWKWELASVLLTIGLLAAIVAIMLHFENRTLADWPLGISLNTLIALLATIMRAAMLVAVAEVIGQLKWTWFSTGRPLNHLQVFDRASRGVWGSLQLLFVAPLSLFALIGGLLTVLSLGIGPFTQQAVRQVNCQRPSSKQNSSVPASHFLNISSDFASSFNMGPGAFALPVEMKGAMVNGLVNPSGNDSAISPTCQSGNCTWQAYADNITYSSIAMCSKCADTTSLGFLNGTTTRRSDNETFDTVWALPNGLALNVWPTGAILNVSTDYDMSWAASVLTDDFFKYAIQAVTNVTMLAITRAPCVNTTGNYTCPHNITTVEHDQVRDGGEWDFVATTCALYPCQKGYYGSVEQGVLSEQVVSTETASYNQGPWKYRDLTFDLSYRELWPGNFTALKSPCVVDGVEYTLAKNFTDVPRTPGRFFSGIYVNDTWYSAPEECLYSLSTRYVLGMNEFLSSTLFDGACVWSDDSFLSRISEPDCGGEWWLSSLYNARYASFTSLSVSMDKFTTAVTNKMRALGTSGHDAASREQELALGVVVEMTVCTVFAWQWILLPAVLVFVTAALLLFMIVKTSREVEVPVWKTSVLPLLFYGAGHSKDKEPKPVADLNELGREAGRIRTMFRTDGDAGFVNTRGPFHGRHDVEIDSFMQEDDLIHG